VDSINDKMGGVFDEVEVVVVDVVGVVLVLLVLATVVEVAAVFPDEDIV
jgi:hypothetical protein